MTFGPLVTTDWLVREGNATDLVLFDASTYLPNEAKNGREEYLKAHIPGARFFDIEAFSDPDTPLPHTLPSQGRFARLAGAEGVGNDTRVVVYDQKGLFSAARAWWLFRYFGHQKVAVLDGGLPKWLAEQRATEAGEPAATGERSFQVNVHARKVRGLGDVLEAIERDDTLILDARAANRFDGSTAEARPGVASGHIPGSQNLPFSRLLRSDHTLQPAETLRTLFSAAGVDGKKPVITSCGSGVTATVLLLGLEVAGLPEGALYDGSWTEWGSRADTPKATGVV
ncbi:MULTISPECIES: 3-mercaptopyruvate sulfurtransferase [unclassified Pseudomonas]|uniref:3-mercaptopyruvate sulfurtransferase n=1 Tax=unclassified Pseudomonas TaxID=196821 RepID=UPI001D28E0C9|nr:3-mercaptopyruvate sulfurtransferase [Pseudomonas sp. Bi70]CAH0277795.1 3-mercaptopyruvate sulfurtransferase [Pseudomonas sp. Bi70]